MDILHCWYCLVFAKETGCQPSNGLRIEVSSQVPVGKGVSSSAALEVATIRALAASFGFEGTGRQLAEWCQIAENQIVGASCGIMDQMTVALGRCGMLMALRCQPATIEGFVDIPEGLRFFGIDSGVRHAVAGSSYQVVRAAAHMGYRMMADLAGLQILRDQHGSLSIGDERWHGYLANVDPGEFKDRYRSTLPMEISGQEFLRQFQARRIWQRGWILSRTTLFWLLPSTPSWKINVLGDFATFYCLERRLRRPVRNLAN